MLRFIFSLFLCFSILPAIAQSIERKEIIVFNSEDLKASSSNISITQDPNGIMYVTNYEGLLSYDGVEWKNELDKETITIIYYDKLHDLLLYGGIDNFGYIKINKNGKLELIPISESLPKETPSYTVWRIYVNDECIFYGTNAGVISWDLKQLNTELFMPNSRIIMTKSKLYFSEKDSILHSIEKCKSNYIESIPEGLESLRLVIEKDSSFIYIDQNGKLINNKKFKTQLHNTKILYPFYLRDSSLVVASEDNGVQIFDNQFNHLIHLNKFYGLSDNFARYVHEDLLGRIWVVTPSNGISVVNYSSPWTEINTDKLNTSFEVLKSYGSILLIGSNAGLFIYSSNVISQISNSRILSIDNNESHIVFSTREGATILNYDGMIICKLDLPITARVKFIDSNHILIVSSRDTYIYKLINNRLEEVLNFDLPNQHFNDHTYVDKNNIWLSTRIGSVYKLKLSDGTYTSYKSIGGYEYKKNIIVLTINNEIHLIADDKIFKYSDKNNDFELSYIFKEGRIDNLEKINDNYIVYGRSDKNERFLIEVNFKKNDYQIVSYRFNNFPFQELNDIVYDENQFLWFSSPNKIWKYDTKARNQINSKFNTLIRKVNSTDTTLSNGYYQKKHSSDDISRITVYQNSTSEPTITYKSNSIRFDYAATFLELPEKTKYSYFLNGNDKAWSEWTKETTKEYTNLDPGQYTFKVKSLNVFKEEGTTATYSFTILPPWYMTTWANLLFAIGGVLGIWFIVLAYSYRIRLQRRKLKLIVADRTFEVLSQKKEIEKQNDLLRDQYEEIQQQRDDINEKNQELEMTQEEILSINERLQELNSSLEKKVDERTSEIRVTVKKLQSTIAELDTFIYRASHDLKGPISRINGLTSLAKLEASNPNDVKYYNLIELVAKDMNKLLAKLTQVHEVINCEVEKSVIDLPVMISDVRNSVKFLDPDDATRYIFNLETTLQIKTDPFLFAILLTNLMENSLIFRKPGKPGEVIISATQSDSHYTITFEDKGSGILPEHIEKVFNMFYRGSDQSKGSGLGLYLSQMAVEKLGGIITVESEYNNYTKFTVSIPK